MLLKHGSGSNAKVWSPYKPIQAQREGYDAKGELE